MITGVSNTPTLSSPSAAASSIVTVVFSANGGQRTGVCHLYYSGLNVMSYLGDANLRGHALLTRMKKRGAVNQRGEKLRMRDCPAPGDTIVLV